VSLLVVTALATTAGMLAWTPPRGGSPRGTGGTPRVEPDDRAEPLLDLDQALLERARRGDGRAFRTIFDRHGGAIRRFLGDLLRDTSAADEATQETFVRAHRGLARISDDAKLRGFLFGIARNVARERRRTGGREVALDDEGDSAPVDHAPSPETLMIAAEADRVLAAALADLPDERRAALLLRIDHDLGYPEIAEAMGWSLQKVKNEIHRARTRMRGRVLAYLGGEP
jgi:RNA polymerase sigma-70 factor (ECF subfamily)